MYLFLCLLPYNIYLLASFYFLFPYYAESFGDRAYLVSWDCVDSTSTQWTVPSGKEGKKPLAQE
jgi:hypothetical protein